MKHSLFTSQLAAATDVPSCQRFPEERHEHPQPVLEALICFFSREKLKPEVFLSTKECWQQDMNSPGQFAASSDLWDLMGIPERG